MELVIGSYNVHKIREFREILKKYSHLDLLSLHNFPKLMPFQAQGESFQQLAEKKALFIAQELKTWVLADDCGLVVPALNGEPGIQSRFYAGEDATDAENRKKLLDRMLHLSDIQRSAYFECSVVLASPEGVKKSVKAICEGTIANEEKGRHGFGYDSLFIKHDYDKTFAELDENARYRISHRRKALEKLAGFLENIRH